MAADPGESVPQGIAVRFAERSQRWVPLGGGSLKGLTWDGAGEGEWTFSGLG